MRRFYLVRSDDVSGVSGLGVVAEGVVFGDGSVEMRWRTEFGGRESWPNIKKCVQCHAHGNRTKLVWVDEVPCLKASIPIPKGMFGPGLDLTIRQGKVHRYDEYKFKPITTNNGDS
ncbi:MAG TPA: hypothetical protein VF747_10250 [Blastocatellia bacterium]|jgi:hypothetical protein